MSEIPRKLIDAEMKVAAFLKIIYKNILFISAHKNLSCSYPDAAQVGFYSTMLALDLTES